MWQVLTLKPTALSAQHEATPVPALPTSNMEA